MFAFFSVIKSISQISKQQHGTHKLFHRYFGHPQWLPDGTVSTFFFRYFSLFSFTSLWKTLCKVKDLWGADLTPWTVSMKEGSPISHVTCCTIQMQIGSCNINCLNQFCKSCKFGGPGKRAAPIYIYIPIGIQIYKPTHICMYGMYIRWNIFDTDWILELSRGFSEK